MVSGEPDLENGVFRVFHVLETRAPAYLTCENDLIFIEDQPFVVLEWTQPGGCHPPTVTVQLDPAHLQGRPGPPGYYLYDLPVLDPRTLH